MKTGVRWFCIYIWIPAFAGRTKAKKKGHNDMLNKTLIKKPTLILFVLMAFGCAGADAQLDQAVLKADEAAEEVGGDSADKNPLVVYYSRTGNCRMLATALGSQLGSDVEEMPSVKDRGIFTIIGEQYFGGKDKQKPFEKNLEDYSSIIVVAPIYLMKFSAPGRFFIKEVIPEGSEVYVITMTGGPPPASAHEAIKEMATEHGLVVQGVHGFQAGKTQEEFDNATRDFLEEHELFGFSPDEVAPSPTEASGEKEESESCEKQ